MDTPSRHTFMGSAISPTGTGNVGVSTVLSQSGQQDDPSSIAALEGVTNLLNAHALAVPSYSYDRQGKQRPNWYLQSIRASQQAILKSSSSSAPSTSAGATKEAHSAAAKTKESNSSWGFSGPERAPVCAQCLQPLPLTTPPSNQRDREVSDVLQTVQRWAEHQLTL
jgi:hypothetical protein